MTENNPDALPPQQQPAYIQQPAPIPYAPPGPYMQPAMVVVQPDIPGKTLGIVSLILPFVGFGLVALILGIVALNQSKQVGYKNTPAIWGIVLGGLSVVAVGVLILSLIIVPLIIGGAAMTQN